MNKSIELEIRRKIYDVIANNLGLSLSEIAEMLDMNVSQVERYLLFMREKGEIIASSEVGHTRYYLGKSRIESQDRRTLITRKKIYDVIAKNPGVHLSRIAEMLGMRTSLAEYHLLHMERNKSITAVKKRGGYYKRFYIKDGEVGSKDKKILALLRQKSLLKIVLILLKNPNSKHKEILKDIDVAPSTLSYHLERLIENDVIDVVPYGKDKGYVLKNEKEITLIIKRYKLDILVDDFKDG